MSQLNVFPEAVANPFDTLPNFVGRFVLLIQAHLFFVAEVTPETSSKKPRLHSSQR